MCQKRGFLEGPDTLEKQNLRSSVMYQLFAAQGPDTQLDSQHDKNEGERIMILVERLRDGLPELPAKGEEFPVHPWEAALGSVLVEETHIRRRSDGVEILQIWGFG